MKFMKSIFNYFFNVGVVEIRAYVYIELLTSTVDIYIVATVRLQPRLTTQ